MPKQLYELVQIHDNETTEQDIDIDESKKRDLSTSLKHGHGHGSVEGGSSISGASFNFINSILGSGVIALPWAVARCGLHFGVFMLIFVAWVTAEGTRIMIECGNSVGQTSYPGLCHAAFGKNGERIVAIFMSAFAFGGLITYLIILGDTMPSVIYEIFSIEVDRFTMIWASAIFIILPLSLLKDLSMLSFASLLSILADFIIAFIVCFSKIPDTYVGIEPDYRPIKSTAISGFGAMAFSYVCHHSAFVVYGSLRKKTVSNWRIVNIISVGSSMITSLALAVGGYMKFFNDTNADVLNNFDSDDSLANLARFCLYLTMVFTYPMELFVMRTAVFSLIKGHSEAMSDTYHYGLTLLIFSVSLYLGLTLQNLAKVVEVVGALTASMIGYVLPPLCFFKLYPYSEWRSSTVNDGSVSDDATKDGRTTTTGAKIALYRESLSIWQYISASCILLFGVVTLFIGTAGAIIN